MQPTDNAPPRRIAGLKTPQQGRFWSRWPFVLKAGHDFVFFCVLRTIKVKDWFFIFVLVRMAHGWTSRH